MQYLKVWDTQLQSAFKGFDIITNHKNVECFIKKQCLNKR